MARKHPTHYVGATKQLAIGDVAALGPRYAIQPKVDGVYVRLHLNSQGRVSHVFLRNGTECPRQYVSHVLGALVGAPHADLVGELEAMTDAGEAAAKVGPRRIHMFDALHDGSRSLVGAPYRDRRDALWRMNAAAQCYAPDDDHRPKPWRRYRDPVLPGWRLCPVVDQVPAARVGWAWDSWVKAGGGEGLVAVALDAPVGRPASKLKVKPWEGLDCVVRSADARHVLCTWNGHPFSVARGKHYVEPGNVVEVKHAGWYAHGVTPKHPSIVRVRRDLLI